VDEEILMALAKIATKQAVRQVAARLHYELADSPPRAGFFTSWRPCTRYLVDALNEMSTALEIPSALNRF
jgi:hypothetical protein